jgi:hypothetical protein
MARFRLGLARDVPSEIAGASFSKLKPGLSWAWMRRGHVILPERLLPFRRLAFFGHATIPRTGHGPDTPVQVMAQTGRFQLKAISNLSCRPGRQVEPNPVVPQPG